jgi:4a-hydroxytetrahydrobiopterin dehydratase
MGMTPRQFQEAGGTQDWRVVFEGACARFRTGTFATGVALVSAIGELAGRHPDVDLRPESVTVRLTMSDPDSLTECDVTLAAQISEKARELGAASGSSATTPRPGGRSPTLKVTKLTSPPG